VAIRTFSLFRYFNKWAEHLKERQTTVCQRGVATLALPFPTADGEQVLAVRAHFTRDGRVRRGPRLEVVL